MERNTPTIIKATGMASCGCCYATNYTPTIPRLGPVVDTIYELRADSTKMKLCESCLRDVIAAANDIFKDKTPAGEERPYHINDEVFAIVKNYAFQLEVVPATVTRIEESGYFYIEKKKTAHNADCWGFPAEAWGQEVFVNEADALNARDAIMQRG